MAKWSPIWENLSGRPKSQLEAALKVAAFTPPSAPKSRSGGGYPHLQPFFKKVKKSVDQE